MRVEATDRYAEDDGVSVMAIGSAEKDGVTKRFEWLLRKSYELTNCEKKEGGGSGEYATSVRLETSDALEMWFEMRGEELFRTEADDEAPIRFEPRTRTRTATGP